MLRCHGGLRLLAVHVGLLAASDGGYFAGVGDLDEEVSMYEYSSKVEHVLDGDTIEVTVDLGFRMFTKMPVRLFGINAPEIHSKSDTEKAHGLKAKAKLEELVSGKTVRIQSAKPNAQGGGDKFGRWLAIVWLMDGLQEKSVNQQLVELGLCKPWDGKGSKPV